MEEQVSNFVGLLVYRDVDLEHGAEYFVVRSVWHSATRLSDVATRIQIYSLEMLHSFLQAIRVNAYSLFEQLPDRVPINSIIRCDDLGQLIKYSEDAILKKGSVTLVS